MKLTLKKICGQFAPTVIRCSIGISRFFPLKSYKSWCTPMVVAWAANKAVNTDAFFVRVAHYKCAGYGRRYMVKPDL